MAPIHQFPVLSTLSRIWRVEISTRFPKKKPQGWLVFGFLKSNPTGPILGNLDPILPKIYQAGSRLRPSNVEFHRLHFSVGPILDRGFATTLMRANLILRPHRRN